MDPLPTTDAQNDDPPKSSKVRSAVRGTIACTVCRSAKMKCIMSQHNPRKCQRCERLASDCVFEKHRRGRKKGSTLSDASKMLRQVERGLVSRQRQGQPSGAGPSTLPPDAPGDADELPQAWSAPGVSLFATTEHPPTAAAAGATPPSSLLSPALREDRSRPATMTGGGDDDDDDPTDRIFPAQLITTESRRNSYFGTVLNPEPPAAAAPAPPTPARAERSLASGTSNNAATAAASSSPPPVSESSSGGGGGGPGDVQHDPVSSGLLSLAQAETLLELVFLRLNPFINLFDPALHTLLYVRSRSPFLFTTLMMAGAKFFKPELYVPCRTMAHAAAVQAFAHGWKTVEVAQAFACLTYWKEPTDDFTWTYIGYAARMAVELGLNRYTPHPPPGETAHAQRERRNRERTFLVLFVHDRSLSTQTGRSWMLPVCELVEHAGSWHVVAGGSSGEAAIRPEDVIVAAFVQLRQIAADATDYFRASAAHEQSRETVLRSTNGKLAQWLDTWTAEMRRKDVANAMSFHFSFINFFHSYVKLFLNSFGLQTSTDKPSPMHLQALSQCYTSATHVLQTIIADFSTASVLRYGQDSTLVMSAYAAIFLLKLLRASPGLIDLHGADVAQRVHSLVRRTAEAYAAAPVILPSDTRGPGTHARFLYDLVAHDVLRAKHQARASRPEESPVVPVAPAAAAAAGAGYGSVYADPGPLSSPQGHGDAAQQVYYDHRGPPPQYCSGQPTVGVHSRPPVGNLPHGHLPSYHASPAQVQSVPPPSGSSPEHWTVATALMSGVNSTHARTPSITEADTSYWRSMWSELGFSDAVEAQSSGPSSLYLPDDGTRGIPPHPAAGQHLPTRTPTLSGMIAGAPSSLPTDWPTTSQEPREQAWGQ